MSAKRDTYHTKVKNMTFGINFAKYILNCILWMKIFVFLLKLTGGYSNVTVCELAILFSLLMRQAVNWTDDVAVHQRIFALFGLNVFG